MRASSDDTAINDLEEWVGHAGCVVAFALAAVGILCPAVGDTMSVWETGEPRPGGAAAWCAPVASRQPLAPAAVRVVADRGRSTVCRLAVATMTSTWRCGRWG